MNSIDYYIWFEGLFDQVCKKNEEEGIRCYFGCPLVGRCAPVTYELDRMEVE